MATSLPPIKIKPNLWYDVYAETGITVGTQLIIQNTGENSVLLTESATEPTQGFGYNDIEPKAYLTNAASNVGAWAYSGQGSVLQVEEA